MLQGVSCTSATFCTAVGFLSKGNRIEMWNGRDWRTVSSPSIPRGQWPALFGVSCRSPSDCVAVGTSSNGVAVPYPTLVVWNGRSWQYIRLPSTGPAYLAGVECRSATSCAATGVDYSASTHPLILVMN